MRRSLWKFLSIPLLAGCLLWLSSGQAEARSAEYIRPIGSIRLSVMSGLPDLIGASLTIKATHPIELEGGISTLLFGWSAYARVGPAFALLNRRGFRGNGWTMDFLIMGGYRYLEGQLFSALVAHGITLNVALNATYWFSRHFGLDMRISLGAGYWVAATSGTRDPPVFPDGRISIGFAF